eukprot:3586657-Rhodomonas_salina.3
MLEARNATPDNLGSVSNLPPCNPPVRFAAMLEWRRDARQPGLRDRSPIIKQASQLGGRPGQTQRSSRAAERQQQDPRPAEQLRVRRGDSAEEEEAGGCRQACLVKEPEHRFHEQTLRTWRDCDTWDEEAKTFAKDCYAKGRRHTDLHRQHVLESESISEGARVETVDCDAPADGDAVGHVHSDARAEGAVGAQPADGSASWDQES